MKITNYLWAVSSATISFTCFHFYFTKFYWHLGITGLISGLTAYVFIGEIVEKSRKTTKKP